MTTGLALLFFGTLFSSLIYIGHSAITPVRIGVSAALLIFILQAKKNRYTYQFYTLLLIIFSLFTYQFFIGTLVSLFTGTLESTTNIIKFLFLFITLTTICLYGNIHKKYLNTLYLTSNYFMLILIIVSYIEITTRNHFSFSAVYKMPPAFHFTPSAFYINQNDFLAIVTLLLTFNTLILVYAKNHNIRIIRKKDYYLYISYLLYSFYLALITTSRTSLVALSFLFIIIISIQKRLVIIIAICLIIIGGLLFLFYFPDIIDKVISYSEIVSYYSGNSTNVRLSLYQDALLNFTIFGEGANNSHLLYTKLATPESQGIINPHNYLLELLINNGVLYFTIYILFNIYLIYKSILLKKYFLGTVFILYHFILVGSSSSLFIWSQYIYYIGFIGFLINISSKDIINSTPEKEVI